MSEDVDVSCFGQGATSDTRVGLQCRPTHSVFHPTMTATVSDDFFRCNHPFKIILIIALIGYVCEQQACQLTRHLSKLGYHSICDFRPVL